MWLLYLARNLEMKLTNLKSSKTILQLNNSNNPRKHIKLRQIFTEKYNQQQTSKMLAQDLNKTNFYLFDDNINNIYKANMRYLHQEINNNKLKENSIRDDDKQNIIATIPNFLTSLRIISIPFINYFVLINKHEYACLLFFVAGLTDFLDGYIARNWKNQKSYLGSIMDPLADKLLIGSLTIALTLNGLLPVQLAFIILGRDLALILFSLYVRYRTLEKPVTLYKYFNVKKYSSVQVEADQISKFNTLLQLGLITLTLPSVVFGYHDSALLTCLQYLTGFTTILSSISYLSKGGSFKLVKK